MATPIGPVASTASYGDNDIAGKFQSGFLFARDNPIDVELTYGEPGSPGDVIEDLLCPANQSINFSAPATLSTFITRVRFKSQSSLAATVSGYVNEPRAPAIIAGISGGAQGGIPLVNLQNFHITGPGLTAIPSFTLPPEFGGFWLGTTGFSGAMDVIVQSQPAVSPAATPVTETYGFSAGNAGTYAVPAAFGLVSMQMQINVASLTINLSAVPIQTWPPPQFEPAGGAILFASTTVSGGGVDVYSLPPYDGDCLFSFVNTSTTNALNVALLVRDYANNLIGEPFFNIFALSTQLNIPLKLPHRICSLQVQGTAGTSYEVTIFPTPRRGGA